MATEVKSVANNIKIFLSKIKKKTTTKSPMIFLVPEFITAEHEEMYKPKMVPIGTYHHGEEKFMAIEERKHQFLNDFLERNDQVNYDTYIDIIQNLKVSARACYSEEVFPSERDDDKFVEVLLIDGCFILELLLKLNEDKRHSRHSWAGWDFMAIMSDLLLVENQIPFFILEKFYTILKGLDENTSKVELKKLVVNNLFIKYLGDSIHSSRVKEPGNIEINHLLHLYHEISLPNSENKEVGYTKAQPTFKNSTWAQPGHGQKDHRLPLVIPSATQLSEFGFKLRKQDSHNNSDPDIKHGRIHSTIKIPRLIIDSARRVIFMNLLAFEQGLEVSKRWTGLLVMMNCLIKNKSDLDILQRNGIVLNLLPSEDEAIQFFRNLSKRVSTEFKDHYYSYLFDQIHQSCEDYFSRKRATFVHEYFNNRWAIISFCTSICAIFLSTVQTLVSIFTYRHRYRSVLS